MNPRHYSYAPEGQEAPRPRASRLHRRPARSRVFWAHAFPDS
ncbi:hypothetical protein BS35_004856 [Actinomadura glauciflava]|nr:hypothetical protein [Actinomadura glauciflava]